MNVEIEHKVVALTIDDTMQAEMDKHTAEGWVLIPEIKPVAIYHLVRAKGAAPLAPLGIGAKLEIDDRKVGVLKQDGYVYWPDGTRSKQGEAWEERVPYEAKP